MVSAHSKDLITWEGETYVPAMAHEPAAMNTWAPELLYDAPNDRFMIYWATTIPGRFPATDVGGGGGKYNHRTGLRRSKPSWRQCCGPAT